MAYSVIATMLTVCSQMGLLYAFPKILGNHGIFNVLQLVILLVLLVMRKRIALVSILYCLKFLIK